MRAFEPAGDGAQAELEEFEVALLTSLVAQLVELLGGAASVPAADLDALAWLAASHDTHVELDHGDPLISRLFPAAYLDDEAASADFRRFTQEDARRTRVEHAQTVLADLEATRDGVEPLWVASGHTEAWLRTVNAVRLALAVRLDITDEASMDALANLSARDPRTPLVDIYDWLGFVLESLLDAL